MTIRSGPARTRQPVATLPPLESVLSDLTVVNGANADTSPTRLRRQLNDCYPPFAVTAFGPPVPTHKRRSAANLDTMFVQ